MDREARLAVLEAKHMSLYERVYGGEGRTGDVDRILEKLDSVVTWQQRCFGAAALLTVAIPIAEHFWK